jgi:hypothetical protein
VPGRTLDLLRVTAAGCFVFVGMAVLAIRFSDQGPSWLIGPLTGIAALLLIAFAWWLFNPKGSSLLGEKTLEQEVRELEEQNLLESTEFQATRVFGVEEFEDEGRHYYLELATAAYCMSTASICTITNRSPTIPSATSRASSHVQNSRYDGTRPTATSWTSSAAAVSLNLRSWRILSVRTSGAPRSFPKMVT